MSKKVVVNDSFTSSDKYNIKFRIPQRFFWINLFKVLITRLTSHFLPPFLPKSSFSLQKQDVLWHIIGVSG